MISSAEAEIVLSCSCELSPNVESSRSFPSKLLLWVEPMISSAEAEIVPEQAAPVEAEPMTDPNVEVEPIIPEQAAPWRWSRSARLRRRSFRSKLLLWRPGHDRP